MCAYAESSESWTARRELSRVFLDGLVTRQRGCRAQGASHHVRGGPLVLQRGLDLGHDRERKLVRCFGAERATDRRVQARIVLHDELAEHARRTWTWPQQADITRATRNQHA